MKCERCQLSTSGYDLHDYCEVCSKNLCDKCMANGCCGNVPARSGMGDEDTQRQIAYDDGAAAYIEGKPSRPPASCFYKEEWLDGWEDSRSLDPRQDITKDPGFQDGKGVRLGLYAKVDPKE